MALTPNPRRLSLALAGFLIGIVAAGFLGLYLHGSDRTGPAPSAIGGPFALVDQNGQAVTDASLRGEPFLVFFGYTQCPDVCPTTLADLTSLFKALPDTKIPALFVTVDPERDTPAVLKDYLSSFDPRIVGLTGSPEAIAAAEKRYRVYAKKVPGPDGTYTMDHTAIVYLMDRDGRFVGAVNLQQSPSAAADEIRRDLS